MRKIHDNQYDYKRGMVEGDHLEHLASIGLGQLVERVNNGLLIVGDRQMREDDLPTKVREAVREATQLSDQLVKCESVPVQVAVDYVKRQGKIAADVLPLVEGELSRHTAEATAALAAVRANLMGKQSGPLMAAIVDELLLTMNADGKAQLAAGISAWRRAFGIVRDTAACKMVPKWLNILAAAHEAHLRQALIT